MLCVEALFFLSAVIAPILAAAAPPEKPYDRKSAQGRYRRPAAIPQPDDNTYSPEREKLGRALFFDPRLSRSGTLSCGGCHNPSFGWTDGLPLAVGDHMKTLPRRTPTIVNLAWAETLFWDGRAASLEEQALGPMAAAKEMNLPLDRAAARIRSIAGYRQWFASAYPREPLTAQLIAKAIAVFERRLVSGAAPFDRWIEGDESALGEEAKRGFDLFNTKANCAACHLGWNFTDDGFHDIGGAGNDPGRGAVYPRIETVQNAFKTPTLRNIAVRAPYLHNGSEPSLESVIDLYDRGGRFQRPSLSPEIRKLQLSKAEKQCLLAFLGSLTSNDEPVPFPQLPR